MKLNAVVLGCMMGFSSALIAAPQHMHTQKADSKLTSSYAPTWANDCEIEIINRSYVDVRVSGMFDDGESLRPFITYSFGVPEYITLYYDGYCHDGMELDIDSVYGRHIYAGYVRGGQTVTIRPSFMNQVKAELKAR